MDARITSLCLTLLRSMTIQQLMVAAAAADYGIKAYKVMKATTGNSYCLLY